MSEERNNRCRQPGLDRELPQEEFGAGWLNTAAKGNYRQVEKLARMEKSKLAEKAMLKTTESEAINKK